MCERRLDGFTSPFISSGTLLDTSPVPRVTKQQTASGTSPSLRPSTGVVARDMGTAAVLIHLESNRIFELNATGARVWALIEQRLSRDAIVARLKGEFIQATDIEEAVGELVNELEREGLIGG
jgi:hypothetical protein